MALSYIKTPSDGSTVLYSVSFGFLDRNHVSVIVNGVTLTSPAGYSWVGTNQLQLASAPTSGQIVEIRRNTPLTDLVNYQNGSNFSEIDLDIDSLQAIYICQEIKDKADDLDTRLNQDRILQTNTSDEYDAVNRKIINVQAGTNPNDAFNVAQGTVIENAANVAINTANTASTTASNAVSTANTAETTANNAVSTANTAETTANNAVSTANTAETTANNAVSTANTASTTASTAGALATTASNDASSAVITANSANTNATNAVSTANTASTTASIALTNANSALDKSWVEITNTDITNFTDLFTVGFPTYKEYKVKLSNLRCTDNTGSRTSSPLYLALYRGSNLLTFNILRSLYTVFSKFAPNTVSVSGASTVKVGEILTLSDGGYAANNYEFTLRNFKLTTSNTPYITGEGICRTDSATSMKHIISSVTGQAGVDNYNGVRFTLDSGIVFTSGTFEIYGRN